MTEMGSSSTAAVGTSESTGISERYQSVQVLRAIAAVAVVLYHVREYLRALGGVEDTIFRVFSEIFSSGATLFFCISGFLMAHLIANQYRNFLPRRVLRIYPTFLVAVLLAVLLEYLAFGPQTRPDLPAALSLLPWGPIAYPLRIEWTLVYEMFFYLVCSVFALGQMRKYFPAFLVAWLLVIVAAWVDGSVAQTHLPLYNTIFFQWYNVYFIAGALTYYAMRRLPRLPATFCYALLAFILLSIAAWPQLKTNPIFWANEAYFLLAYTIATLIVALSLSIAAPRWLSGFAGKLGDYSYGIYLIHAPVIVVVIASYKQHFGEPGTLVGLAAFLACMVCGWYLGKLDLRIHRWVAKHVFRKRSLAPIEAVLDQPAAAVATKS